MTPDPPPGRAPGPSRLWTEPREEEEHTPWLAPRSAVTEVQPPRDEEPPPPRPRRLWPLVALGTVIALVLMGTGIGAALVLDRATSTAEKVTAALPASPGAAPADSRAKAVRSIYSSASPSVVSVLVQEGSAGASGTGFVIDDDGTIVTNAHVVEGAAEVQVRLDDGNAGIDAEVLGTDASSDLAVLRVDASDVAGLRPLVLADSDNVQVGDLAVAIGYPLGLDRTATAGIVSGVGRAIKAPNGFQIDKVIQTDAPINPGNSGGPLLDAAGRVIGVNSQIATAGGGGNVGIGFAVPANTVREVVPRLESGTAIKRPYLGVSTVAGTGSSGAEVAGVVAGGPAQAGGLQQGDVITGVADQPVVAPEDVSSAIEQRRPGDKVNIEVQRAGSKQTLSVTLGTRPEKTP